MKAYSIWLIEAIDHKYDLNKVWHGMGHATNSVGGSLRDRVRVRARVRVADRYR